MIYVVIILGIIIALQGFQFDILRRHYAELERQCSRLRSLLDNHVLAAEQMGAEITALEERNAYCEALYQQVFELGEQAKLDGVPGVYSRNR